MKSFFKRVLNKEDGQALVLFVLALTVLAGFAALTIDVGALYVEKRALQNIADASALAGAQDVHTKNVSDIEGTALEFAKLNGLKVDSNHVEKNGSLIDANANYDSDPEKVEVIVNRKVKHYFARFLGFNESNVMARAVGVGDVSPPGGPFHFALFSGDPNSSLILTGQDNARVIGHAHSNEKFIFQGANTSISGDAQSVSDFEIIGSNLDFGGNLQGNNISDGTSNVRVGENRIVEAAPFIEMPDFSDIIENAAKEQGQYYTVDQTFDNEILSIDEPIFIDGNLSINNSTFTGQGVILATGNISIKGSGYLGADSAVSFYSSAGNINIHDSEVDVHGILYAPNGTVDFNKSVLRVYGRVVAKKVKFFMSNIDIQAGEHDLKSLPKIGDRGSKLVE